MQLCEYKKRLTNSPHLAKRRKKSEKVEELKREAKLSRELVQMEKFMEERKKKRQRRDEEDGPEEISQNEMF